MSRQILRSKILTICENICFMDNEINNVIKKVKNDKNLLLTFSQAQLICYAVKATQNINGEIAELGVYAGRSAKLIAKFKGNKFLSLFDTFNSCSMIEEFNYDINEVKKYLQEYSNIRFYEGIFPETIDEYLKQLNFSFVHLDADLYQSTFDGLKFFYPRLSKDGIIIIHDYNSNKWTGVKKAVKEYFNPLMIGNPFMMEMNDTQLMIVKRENVKEG